jgi:uncharacterized cupin superfamily protein
MAGIRRVVTGVDGAGRSVVVGDGPAPRAHEFAAIPGMATALIWSATGGRPWQPEDGDPTLGADPDEPPPGGLSFLTVRFPPDSRLSGADFDAGAAAAEQRRVSPRLHSRFAADVGGMHTTPTTDYVTVVEGEIHAELDGGVLVALGPGDTLVHNGARHGWRNLGDRDAVITVVMVGRT